MIWLNILPKQSTPYAMVARLLAFEDNQSDTSSILSSELSSVEKDVTIFDLFSEEIMGKTAIENTDPEVWDHKNMFRRKVKRFSPNLN